MNKIDKYKELLKSRGCENIESYVLISNWGYRFIYKGLKCDIRYWANCYGACLDRFEIHTDKIKADELCIWTELKDIENAMNNMED